MNSRLAISSRNDYERELADTDKMQSKPNTFCNTFNIRELEAIVSSSYTRDDDKKLEAFLRVRKYLLLPIWPRSHLYREGGKEVIEMVTMIRFGGILKK